jgi:hypothetical protein
MLTVVHEGATVSMHVLVLSTKTKKKITGQVGPMKMLIFTKSTSTNKIHRINFPCRNAHTPGTKSRVPGDKGEIIVGSHLKADNTIVYIKIFNY